MSDKDIIIPEDELFELYGVLADATEAAASGDPNECSRLASEAKDMVIEIRENATVNNE